MRFILFFVFVTLLCTLCRIGRGAEILAGGYFAPTFNATPLPPEGRPTALRGRSERLLYAKKGAKVMLTLTCFQAGENKDAMEYSILTEKGAILQNGKVGADQISEITFSPPEDGVYKIICDAGPNASEVEASGARLSMRAEERQPLHVFDHARKLWFYVPRDSDGFRVRIGGQGKEETVAVKVWSALGEEVGTATTVGSDQAQAQVDVSVPEGRGDSLWSLQLMKATEGIFEDAYLALCGGVAPYVSECPQDVFSPMMHIELSSLYRRDIGGPLIGQGALLAPLYLLRRPITFIHMIDLQSGESIYSEMLFRFGRGGYKIRLPQDKVWRGSFLTRVTLREDEKVMATFEQTVRVVNPPNHLNSKGVLSVDGKPFFARGLAHVEPADYEMIKQQGFNLVQASPDHLNACDSAGLKAMVVLSADMKINLDHYRQVIMKHKSNPAVACWMIMDEPCVNRVPLHEVEAAYSLIREIDPEHPVFMCICPCRQGVYKEYGPVSDIIAVDVYPVGRHPLTEIARCLDVARSEASEQPIWFVGQVWGWPGRPGLKGRTLVTPAQHRCMTYLALTHGNVRGLVWYSFRDLDWYLPKSNPEVWAVCKRVNDELAALEPVLLEPNKWERVVKGEGEIHLCLKPNEDKLYLIAVNPTEKAMYLTLDLADEGPEPEAKVLFEDRAVKLTGTTLTDQFEPLAVHVYELQKGPLP